VLACDPDFALALLGSMRSGLVAIDAEGRLAALNDGAQRILRGPAGPAHAWIGRDCREALALQPTLTRLLLETLDGRERPSRAELALAGGPDGRQGPTIGFTLMPVRTAGGEVIGAALVFRDLTPIERGDEQERLRERLAALGQMAAGLAHELRTPLATMEVLAGLLRRRLETAGGREQELGLLADLTAELRSLAGTVTESLEFVKPLAPEKRPIEPAALLEEALILACQRQRFAGAVERRFEGPLPTLHGDAEPLRAMLVNLLVNAFEAMAGMEAEGQRVSLGLRVESGERAAPVATWAVRADGGTRPPPSEPAARALVIEIADSGPGVPAELRERIFYPFFTTKQRGSGIGLALAQKVVASHGGSLELVDAGGGACFRLRLPLEEARHP
jgi:signal transduction histidine kinase